MRQWSPRGTCLGQTTSVTHNYSRRTKTTTTIQGSSAWLRLHACRCSDCPAHTWDALNDSSCSTPMFTLAPVILAPRDVLIKDQAKALEGAQQFSCYSAFLAPARCCTTQKSKHQQKQSQDLGQRWTNDPLSVLFFLAINVAARCVRAQ